MLSSGFASQLSLDSEGRCRAEFPVALGDLVPDSLIVQSGGVVLVLSLKTSVGVWENASPVRGHGFAWLMLPERRSSALVCARSR